jgi:hypothetical protein
MGRALDFDDYLDKKSQYVAKKIDEAAEYILSDKLITMRSASRELGIPRRTLHRYLLEYTIRLQSCAPRRNEYGEEIDYDEINLRIQRRIKEDVIKYQKRRWWK